MNPWERPNCPVCNQPLYEVGCTCQHPKTLDQALDDVRQALENDILTTPYHVFNVKRLPGNILRIMTTNGAVIDLRPDAFFPEGNPCAPSPPS